MEHKQTPQQRKPKTHNDYLLSVGHEFYYRAKAADKMHRCLYWLDRYYEANNRLIQQTAKRERIARQQQANLRKQLRKK